jgi:hypothetical protein
MAASRILRSNTQPTTLINNHLGTWNLIPYKLGCTPFKKNKFISNGVQPNLQGIKCPATWCLMFPAQHTQRNLSHGRMGHS